MFVLCWPHHVKHIFTNLFLFRWAIARWTKRPTPTLWILRGPRKPTSIDRHLIRSTQTVPISCPTCGYRFGRRAKTPPAGYQLPRTRPPKTPVHNKMYYSWECWWAECALLLLTCITFNADRDMYLHHLKIMLWNYLSMSKLQRCRRWSLGMGKWFRKHFIGHVIIYACWG